MTRRASRTAESDEESFTRDVCENQRALARRGGDPEQFQEINKAYDVLSDPERRKYYDRTGRLERTYSPRPGGESPCVVVAVARPHEVKPLSAGKREAHTRLICHTHDQNKTWRSRERWTDLRERRHGRGGLPRRLRSAGRRDAAGVRRGAPRRILSSSDLDRLSGISLSQIPLRKRARLSRFESILARSISPSLLRRRRRRRRRRRGRC